MRYFRPGFICRPPLLVTWNAQDKSANIDLSGGNLIAAANASGDGGVRAVKVRGSGKWYCELNLTARTGGDTCVGLAAGDPTFASIGSNATHAYVQFHGGNAYINGSGFFSGLNINSGGVVGVAYDGDAHLAWLTVDGTHWNDSGGTGTPAAGTGGKNTSAFDGSGLYPVFVSGASGDACTGNFGKTSFTFTIPVGFSNWNTS